MSERIESLLAQMLEQMKQQTDAIKGLTQSNMLLIQALSESDPEADPYTPPATYMDGTPVVPPTVERIGSR